MNDVVLPQASLFLGIIPALVLLYISLKGYEGHYEDKNIFLTFVVGIILGFIASLVRILIPLAALNIIIFAVFEQLFKTIVLNFRRFQKKGTVIYGLSLGLGFGAIFTTFLIVAVGSSIINDMYIFSLIMIGAIGMILFHSASGVYIGYGIHTSKLTKYLTVAIIVQFPFNGIMFMTRLSFDSEIFPYLQIGLVVYGMILYWYVTKKIMPRILEQNQKRKRSKK